MSNQTLSHQQFFSTEEMEEQSELSPDAVKHQRAPAGKKEEKKTDREVIHGQPVEEVAMDTAGAERSGGTEGVEERGARRRPTLFPLV